MFRAELLFAEFQCLLGKGNGLGLATLLPELILAVVRLYQLVRLTPCGYRPTGSEQDEGKAEGPE